MFEQATPPGDLGILEEEQITDPVAAEEFKEKRGCQEAIANVIEKLHGYIGTLKKAQIQLVFRKPTWQGLLLYMNDNNPQCHFDPHQEWGSFFGIRTLANMDPQETEVLIEREGDLPTITLQVDTLTRLAEYWRKHGGRQV